MMMLVGLSPVKASEPTPLKYSLFLTMGASYDAVSVEKLSNPLRRTGSLGRSTSAGPFLSSLLIPGWGQYKQGRKNQALMFFGFELAMWGGMFAVKSYGEWLENDYRTFAVLHAGIDTRGKDHDYYVDIGNYQSLDEFNQVQQLERDYESLYLSGDYQWEWDGDSNRQDFKNLRIKADKYKHSVIYFAGAIVINHLVSAVEAARHARKKESLQAGVEFTPEGSPMLTIIKEF